MARTIAIIKKQIVEAFMVDTTIKAIYDLADGAVFENEFSKVSFENILFDIVAYAIWLLENLFDTHKKEVHDIIEAKMPHRPNWYRTKALAFQYGFALILDSDKYDNTGYTSEQIENSKVIKYAAVTKSGGQLYVKIATETDGLLAPIAPEVKTAFGAYMEDVADCGVKYLVVNNLPDILNLYIQIFRDPLVLDANGMSILNANYPVQDAINEYMKQLPFNGELVLAHLVDKLQQVPGVKIPNIYNATSEAVDINTGDYLPAEYINVKTVPVAGYFTIANFDNLSYVV
jgi:hypothetical protein